MNIKIVNLLPFKTIDIYEKSGIFKKYFVPIKEFKPQKIILVIDIKLVAYNGFLRIFPNAQIKCQFYLNQA